MRRTLSIAAGIAVVSIVAVPVVAQEQAAEPGVVIQTADDGRLRVVISMFGGLRDPLIVEADSVDVRDVATGLRISFGGRALVSALWGLPAREAENLQIGISTSPACFAVQSSEWGGGWRWARTDTGQSSNPTPILSAGTITPPQCAGVGPTATQSAATN